MWFDFVYTNSNINKGTLQYLNSEESLYYQPWQENDFSIMIDNAYSSLDVLSSTGEVVQLSGLNPKKFWISKKLIFPIAKSGKLIFHHEKPLLKGIGIEYTKEWKTFYDSSIGCICIGSDALDSQCTCIEFSNNLIAVLKEHALLAIWAKVKVIDI